MAVDFDEVEDVAATVAQLYGEAERAITHRITRQLAQGVDAPGWATAKLDAIGALRTAARTIVAGLTVGVSEVLRAGMARVYRNGWGDALADVADLFAPDSGIGAAARRARQRVPGTAAVEALAASLVRDLRPVHDRIVREPLDAFRAVVGAATARTLTGVSTRREAAQAAWTGLVGRGLVRFTDKGGRDWRLTSYVEMATRTVTARAATQGHVDALTAIDSRLVYVSDAPQECEMCRPWEHQVLSLWGDSGLLYVPHELTGELVAVEVAADLETARALGLHHPNCRHSINAYFPGVTRLRPAQADPEGDRARQRQRYLERRIRHAKEREAAAFTDDARAAARRRVRDAQAALRDHLAEHPQLKRLRYREQIGGGNLPPAGRRDDAAAAIGPVPTADRGPLDGIDLATVPDAELFRLWDEHGAAVYADVAAELERRDADRGALVDDLADDQQPDRTADAAETLAALEEDLAAQRAHYAEQDARDRERAEREALEQAVDRLVARGWDYVEAYAEVYGEDVDELRRQERLAALDADRIGGETREQTVRRLYDEWVHLQYLRAEQDTRGHMLTPAAEAKGVDPVSLFSGPAHIARAQASEDLLRWWAEHGRKTFTEFRAEVLGRESDVRRAEQIRLRGNDRDFGV